MISEKRKEKFRSVFSARQTDLSLVLENIHDPHNVSAILRTCDAVGIGSIQLLYNYEKFPRIGKKSSSSALKWVEREKHTSVASCVEELHNSGHKIYASVLSEDAVDFYSLDFTEKTAVVVGNEHRGVSDEMLRKADKLFYIPMFGMIQSLNVSVATAVILYEALRQRREKRMYDKVISEEQLEILIKKYSRKK
ncbi:MAG: RNA methyltransferase [Ignavibacteriaceae bacterium]|nr:RNA methyltransferase [Ignavibacteriaceae bacterium]